MVDPIFKTERTRGITLTETLLALTILSIGVTAAFQVFTADSTLRRKEKEAIEAWMLMENQTEHLRLARQRLCDSTWEVSIEKNSYLFRLEALDSARIERWGEQRGWAQNEIEALRQRPQELHLTLRRNGEELLGDRFFHRIGGEE